MWANAKMRRNVDVVASTVDVKVDSGVVESVEDVIFSKFLYGETDAIQCYCQTD